MKRVIILLLLGALVVGVVGCSSGGAAGIIFGGYSITISSTFGGTVTSPGEGLFHYPRGTVINLVAEPDRGYQFVLWSTNAGTVADIHNPTTTITLNQNYLFITANFDQ